MPDKETFSIANLLFENSAKSLNKLSGFGEFLVDNGKSGLQPELTIFTDKNLDIKAVNPLYKSSYDEADFAFGAENGEYFVTLTRPACEPMVARVWEEDRVFRAAVNGFEAYTDYDFRFLIWMVYGIAAVHHKTVSIHSSAVVYHGQTLLFLGESGAGKSTQTRLWRENIAGVEMLNDDSPFVSTASGVRAFGSPWSGKAHYYRNSGYPTAAFIRVRQAPYNKIRRLSRLEAIGALLPSCPPAFAYDAHLSSLVHGIVSDVLSDVPVYMLDCLPDVGAVEVTFHTVLGK